MKLYKLTDKEGYTRRGMRNETQWGEGVTHTAYGYGGLCTDGVIHAYEHPLLAAFMNPIQANLKDPQLWEAEGEIVAREGQLKCGVKTLTTLRKIDLPVISTEQRVEIAIRCALLVYKDPNFLQWAENWISGKDRSAEAAAAAEAAEAEAAAAKAAARAAWAAAWEAEAAAEAAAAAAWEAAAWEEAEAEAAWEAEAEAAAAAAWEAAAEAAEAAAAIDLLSIIQSVVN